MPARLLPTLALMACTSYSAEGPWVEARPRLDRALQRAVDDARAEQDLPGLAMAVAFEDTRELWVGTSGLADVDQGVPWVTTHASRIGSVTKTYTAAVALQLVEEGALSLDDTVESWVPGSYTGPTLEHLLANTSGIPSYNYIGSFDTSRPWTPEELVQWAWDLEPALHFEPGTRWEYSNTNFVLLGLVIEAATGQSYEAAVQERLLDPLDLGHTRLDGSGDAGEDLVRCYADDVDITDDLDPSFGWAAGSLVATPTDLALWGVALYGGGVLEPQTLERMTTPSEVSMDAGNGYGLGTLVESDEEYTIHGHTGGISGYLTYMYRLQEPPVTLVLMANRLPADLRVATGHGWEVVLD